MDYEQIDLTCNHDVVIDILDDFALDRCVEANAHAFANSGYGGESEIASNSSPRRLSLLNDLKSRLNLMLHSYAEDPVKTSPFLKTCAPDSVKELV
jgi:hypothetical protein